MSELPYSAVKDVIEQPASPPIIRGIRFEAPIPTITNTPVFPVPILVAVLGT